jgi:DNA mismatch repair protein MutL
MSRIHQLDTFTINQIAAGEVIERPVSVVKELIENALDAGAGSIRTEIRDGGLKQIRVTDDGVGMSSEEAALSVQRHATSKLRQIEDLDQLTTLGFRGEALPSIASVSKLEILTREHTQNQGTRLRLSGDGAPDIAAAGAPTGTAVTVEDLFFNTPARLKFLKTPGYEGGLVHGLIIQFALGFPKISFKLENQGKLILDTTGVCRLEELTELFYGPESRRALVHLDGQASRARVYGAVTRPPYARSNRKGYHFFINGRNVTSKELTRAVENACYSLLPRGRFALAVLWADLPGEWVDVNAHPGKLEVRLRDSALAGALSAMIRDAFAKQSQAPLYQTSQNRIAQNPSSPYSRAFSSDPKIDDGWRDLYRTGPAAAAAGSDGALPAGLTDFVSDVLPAGLTDSAQADSVWRALPGDLAGFAGSNAGSMDFGGGPAFLSETRALPPLKAVGQLRNTFILAEGETGLYILDQHVVHERILYEQFERKHENGTLEAQMLLTPVSLELTVMEEELLLTQLPLLEDFGVIIEPFGARHYLMRSAPGGLEKDPEAFFRDFLAELEAESANRKPLDAKRDLLISLSCKKAVKAHWTLSLQEMQSLLDQLRLTRFPLICPHGRPILYELPYARLLQIFGRK